MQPIAYLGIRSAFVDLCKLTEQELITPTESGEFFESHLNRLAETYGMDTINETYAQFQKDVDLNHRLNTLSCWGIFGYPLVVALILLNDNTRLQRAETLNDLVLKALDEIKAGD